MQNFKAYPLNRKVNNYFICALRDDVEQLALFMACPVQIFSSKGEMGVFRNSKQETTIPMVSFYFFPYFLNAHSYLSYS